MGISWDSTSKHVEFMFFLPTKMVIFYGFPGIWYDRSITSQEFSASIGDAYRGIGALRRSQIFATPK